MLEVLFSVRILAVEVAVVGQQLIRRYLPCALVLLALRPPVEARLELIELDGLSLGVILPALGKGLLVLPDLAGRTGAIEQEQVGGDARVRRKHAVG